MISTSEETRLSELDKELDALLPQSMAAVSADLFAVVDLLETQSALRRALTDQTQPVAERESIAQALLGERIHPDAMTVVAATCRMRWHSGRSLVTALERQGVRAAFTAALANATLDQVEDDLFRFSRTVSGDDLLRQAVNDRTRPVADRQQLVTDLLDGRVGTESLELARRAVIGVKPYAVTMAHYLDIAAAIRQRAVATVRVVSPLTDEQQARLRAALSKQVGREVSLHVIVDPQVLGGVRVEIGDEVIEGTVAHRLDEARRLFR